MKSGTTMRVARPTDNLKAIAEMYAKGLGLTVLARFEDHRGFDGVILGHPKQPYHIEFTSQEDTRSGKHQLWTTFWSFTSQRGANGKQAVHK